MANATQQYENNSTKTQKEKNKEAIQNINKSGTLSGKPSGVSNMPSYAYTNTNTSDLSGTNQKQNGTPRITTPSGPTGINTNTSNLAGVTYRNSGSSSKPKAYNDAFTTPTNNSKYNESPKSVKANIDSVNDTLKTVKTQDYKAPQYTRNDFRTDHDYENYIVENKVDVTKGDVRDYVRNKANEQGTTSKQYIDQMRNNYKNYSETQSMMEKSNNGTIGESAARDINNRFGVLVDDDDNEVDIKTYENQVEMYNATNDNVGKQIEKLNKDYTAGKMDYNSYLAEYNRLKGVYDQNIAIGEKLKGVRALQGFDYYRWAKEQGRDVTDFERYVENTNDLLPERLAQEWAASWVDTANTIPAAVDMILKLIDPSHEDSSWNTAMRETAAELREYAYAGANQFDTWSTRTIAALMPMINSMITGAGLSAMLPIDKTKNALAYLNPTNMKLKFPMKKTAEGIEAFTDLAAGVQSATTTFRQRLEEGNDVQTAFANAVMHGYITAAVEGMNAGDITNILTGDLGKWMSGLGLFQKVGPKAALGILTQMGISEGAEEIVETAVDALVDATQNFVVGGLTGQRVNVEFNPADMASEFLMAAVGSVVMGGLPMVATVIDSKRKYNAAAAALEHCQTVINDPTNSIAEKGVAEKVAELCRREMGIYMGRATDAAKAVDLPDDHVEPMPSYEELMNNLANATKPDIQAAILQAQIKLEKNTNILSNLQSALLERGIHMDANEYVQMDPARRIEDLNIAKQLKDSGLEVWYMDLGRGINGYNDVDNNRVLINTNQTSTIDIDNLVDMDEAAFTEAVTKNIESIFTENAAGANASAATAAAHEITHYAEKSGYWKQLRDLTRDMMGADRFDTAVNRIDAIYKGLDKNANAEREVVAYFVQKNLGNTDFLKKISAYNSSMFSRLFTKTKNFFTNTMQAKLEQTFLDAFMDAGRKLETAGTPALSVGSMFQSLGMTVEKDSEHTIAAYKEDGTRIRKVTVKDVMDSPFGNVLKMSADYGTISREDYIHQVNMMKNICNTLLKTQDADMYWAISGSIGYSPLEIGQNTKDVSNKRSFSALTSNADKQYKTTFDVITICVKTQQLIDVASRVMVKLGRGLTQEEIVNVVYREVFNAGEPVPCPVCYVFSRWVGLGGVLNDIKNFQEKYKGADLQALKDRYVALSKKVDSMMAKKGIRDVEARDELRKQFDAQMLEEYATLFSDDTIEKLGGKKMSAEKRQEYESLKKDMEILNDWSYVTNVLLDVKKEKGVKTIKLNQKYLENGDVPPDTLFDLNKGEDFSNYAAWTYRTGRGAALGKAITPYTDMVLGQTILGFATPSWVSSLGSRRSAETNAFLGADENDQADKFMKAIINARIQNLKGGSRAQSTSDFRFEFVTDYILHFMQLQAIGSYGQTYTKVPEAVPMLCSVFYEVNMSLMPKGKGYTEAKEGDPYAYYVSGFDGVKDGWYTLEFSDKTGINSEEAFYLREKFDNAQTIMVGINEVHNYLSRLDPRVDYIIPYHASGGTEANYETMMSIVGEATGKGDRVSYENSQNDKRVANPTVEQQEAYDLRKKILGGEAEHLSEYEKEVMARSDFLTDLWRRFYEKGYDSECYGVKMDDTDTIFPYEYWDRTSTRETADVNGRRFGKYCDELGIIPRFNQWRSETGYWKTLIDRSMYNVDGTYHQQKAVNMGQFNTDFLFRDRMVKGLVQPEKNATPVFNSGKTNDIVDKVIDVLNRRNGQYSLGKSDGERKFYTTGNTDIDDLMDQIIESMTDEELREYLNTGSFDYATSSEVENDPEVQEEGLWVKEPEGDYIKIDDGYVSNGKTVAWKDERIDAIINENERKNFAFSGHDKYQYFYALNISPKEYIALSYIFEPKHNEVWRNDIQNDPEFYKNGEVVAETLGEPEYRRLQGYMYLMGEYDGTKLKLDRQEGNHRSIILADSGYTKMPIILGTNKPLSSSVVLEGMDAKKMGIQNPNKKLITSNDYVEFTSENRDRLVKKFGSGANANIQYSLGAQEGYQNLYRFVEDNPDATFLDPRTNEYVSFKEVYENMKKRFDRALQMYAEEDADGLSIYTDDDIFTKTGWRFDPNDPGKPKVEFYDDGSVNKLAEYVMKARGRGTKWNSLDDVLADPKIGDILGENSLFLKMYPKLQNVRLTVTTKNINGGETMGRYGGNAFFDQILVSKRKAPGSKDYSINELTNTIAHEIQHFIQEQEHFAESPEGTRYDDRIEEIEASEAGEYQARPVLRGVDNRGNMVTNDESNDAEIPSRPDGGDVNENEPADGLGGTEEELDNGDEMPEGEGSGSESSGDDAEGLSPDEIAENITDNLYDDGAKILRGGPKAKQNTWKDIIRWIRHHFGDHLDAVEDLARKTKNKEIISKADTAMYFRSFANNAILNGRTELLSKDGKIIGESLESILSKIPKGAEEDFDYYMYHYRNLDTTSLRERRGLEYVAKKYLERNPMRKVDGNPVTPEELAKTIEEMEKNLSQEQLAENPFYSKFMAVAGPKYVFGTPNIGNKESAAEIKRLEQEHPEFKKIAEKIWEYGRQDLQVLKDAGILAQEEYDDFVKDTPHYVPIMRNVDKAKFEGNIKLDPNKAIRRFKGSAIDMYSLEAALINHTYNVYRSALTNNLHQEIYKTLKGNGADAVAEGVEALTDDSHEYVEKVKDGSYRMYTYLNGARKMVNVDQDLYNSLTPRRMGMTIPGISTINEVRRNLITSWNPLFAATNAIKDFNDALYNTKYFWSFWKNYPRAWKQILTNGELKQMYLRNGGAENTYLNELGKKEAKWNPIRKVQEIGDAIELAPRLAEFISSIEAGNSLETAMYDAAEITTNFKRGGDWAKNINRNGAAFFNASIQGFEKQVRNWKDAKDGGAKGLLTYMARTVLLSGIPLFILNNIAWDDDDDYKELSDYIKDNYYIIAKVGNRFIRIPKGRVAAFYQMIMTRTGQTLKGQVKMWDALMDVIQSGVDNIAPNNPVDNFLLSPLIQAATGKTWYHGDLIPSSLQKQYAEEQYDYSTDILSIFLGEKLKISPYKINYVLDQYSGALGDILLPMFSLQADNGIDNKVLAAVVSPILDKFTTDPVMKKQAVSSVYELRDELEKAKNSKYATDENQLAYKYISSVTSKMGELYQQMRETQGDPKLSNSEKYAKVRELKDQINKYAQIGLASYDNIDIDGGYANVGGVMFHTDADGDWTKMRVETIEKMNGLTDEQKGQYYNNYYNVQSAREQVKKATPEGKRVDYREATIGSISKADMDYTTKNAMLDSYFSGKFTDAVNSMDLTDEQKYNMKTAKIMADSEKDANGKTISNSKAKAVAEAYEELGVLDDVLQYIADNDIEPSVMGLSKTVYAQYGGKSSSKSKGTSGKSSGTSSSKSSTKKKKKIAAGTVGGSAPSVSRGTVSTRSASRIAGENRDIPIPTPMRDAQKPASNKGTSNKYLKAYSKTIGSRGTASGGRASVTCPNCGSRVTPINGRCPVCGNAL